MLWRDMVTNVVTEKQTEARYLQYHHSLHFLTQDFKFQYDFKCRLFIFSLCHIFIHVFPIQDHVGIIIFVFILDLIKGIDCAIGTNKKDILHLCHRTKRGFLVPLNWTNWSITFCRCGCSPSQEYTDPPIGPIPQATSSNRDLISAVYCRMAKGQEHMPFPYFPLRWVKCVLLGILLISQSHQAREWREERPVEC